MAEQFQSEQILNLPLLPIDGRDGIGQRSELRIIRRDWDAQDDKSMGRINRVSIIDPERPLRISDVIGKNTYQPRVPFLIEVAAKASGEFHLRMEVHFIGLRDSNGGD